MIGKRSYSFTNAGVDFFSGKKTARHFGENANEDDGSAGIFEMGADWPVLNNERWELYSRANRESSGENCNENDGDFCTNE